MLRSATATIMPMESDDTLGEKLQTLGSTVTRYGLVAVFVWIGAMKFTAYEASALPTAEMVAETGRAAIIRPMATSSTPSPFENACRLKM